MREPGFLPVKINREAMEAFINGRLVYSTVAHAVDYGIAMHKWGQARQGADILINDGFPSPFNDPQPHPDRFLTPKPQPSRDVSRTKDFS